MDFSEFINVLEDDEFDERPVDLYEFVTHQNYLGLPPLSDYQYKIIQMGTQIYKESSLIKLYGDEEGVKRHKLTKKELVLALGKACNVGSDEVYNAENGQWVKISDMQNAYSGYTAGLNGNEFCTESFSKGIANTYRVQTAMGFYVRVSENHSFMTKTGPSKLKDLSVGDRIAVSRKLDIINPVEVGYDRIIEVVDSVVGSDDKRSIRVPKDIFSTTDDEVGLFLRELWFAPYGGTVSLQPPKMKYVTLSLGLAQDLQRLLARVGAMGTLTSDGLLHTVSILDFESISAFYGAVEVSERLFYDKIISIEEVGAEEVFTLTAGDTHFYNAGMIMNGNSGK